MTLDDWTALAGRVRDRIRRAAPDWDASCPAGAPVPDDGGCPDCDSVRLRALREGERATVSCLEHPGDPASQRLAALGVLPGVELRMIQRSPVFVVRMGYAELAVDRELADRVRVRRTV